MVDRDEFLVDDGRSFSCKVEWRDNHARCEHLCPEPGHRHLVGVVAARYRKTPARLCRCQCHATCPLAGRTVVPESEWLDQCTCEGSARRRHGTKAITSFDWKKNWTDDELRADLIAAFAAEGEELGDQELTVLVLAGKAVRATGPTKWKLEIDTLRAAAQPVIDVVKLMMREGERR